MAVARRQPPEPALATRADRLLLAGLLLGVAAVVTAAHWHALSARAIAFDDDQYLLNNRLVLNPGRDSARRFLTEVLEPSTVRGYYQPLAMISLMADAAVGGSPSNLRPFHRTSLALHVANTVLVILLLHALFGRPMAAAVAGLLFGVHPMTVEPVAWIGERKTVLATFFALGSLIAYVHYTRGIRGQGRHGEVREGESASRRVYYVASLAAYALALLSKPTTTALPLAMLLMDYWPLNREATKRRGDAATKGTEVETQARTAGPRPKSQVLSPQSLLWEKLPFFAVGIFSAVITYISQARTAAIALPTDYEPGRIPLTLLHNVVFYLWKIVVPVDLTPHYAFPKPFALSNPAVLAGVAGTTLLVAGLLISLRWTRAFAAGWLIFFVTIFPTMGVIGFTNVIASDKYAYLPSIGLLMVLAWGLPRAWAIAAARRNAATACGAFVVMLAGVAAAEIALTRRQADRWRDTERLYRHMIAVTPHVALLHNNLGGVLIDEGRIDEAIECFQRSLDRSPRYVEALGNLAAALQEKGRLEEAIGYGRRAVAADPTHARSRYNLANALHARGDVDEAIEHWEKAIALTREYAEAHNNLGGALLQKGRPADAVPHFRETLRIRPDHLEAAYNLACALMDLGRLDEAAATLDAAMKTHPDSMPLRRAAARLRRMQRPATQAAATAPATRPT